MQTVTSLRRKSALLEILLNLTIQRKQSSAPVIETTMNNLNKPWLKPLEQPVTDQWDDSEQQLRSKLTVPGFGMSVPLKRIRAKRPEVLQAKGIKMGSVYDRRAHGF